MTNFKPVLGEQLDLRATDFHKQVQSKQKVIEYIVIRPPSNSDSDSTSTSTSMRLRYESDIEIAFC